MYEPTYCPECGNPNYDGLFCGLCGFPHGEAEELDYFEYGYDLGSENGDEPELYQGEEG